MNIASKIMASCKHASSYSSTYGSQIRHLVERSKSTMTETYQRQVYSEAIHNRKHHLPPSCSEKRLKYSSKAGKACGSVYHLGLSTRCIFTGKKLMTPLDIEVPVPCFSGIFRLPHLNRGWTWRIFRARVWLRVLWRIIWRCCGVLIIQHNLWSHQLGTLVPQRQVRNSAYNENNQTSPYCVDCFQVDFPLGPTFRKNFPATLL